MEALRRTQPQVSILIAEDERMSREAFGILIRKKFPDVWLDTVENGQLGLEAFRRHKYDIVIADISMPVMDGIRMATEIKAIKPDAIIIFVTAHSDTRYIERAEKLGVQSYLTKPIDFKKLFAEIESSIEEVTLSHSE